MRRGNCHAKLKFRIICDGKGVDGATLKWFSFYISVGCLSFMGNVSFSLQVYVYVYFWQNEVRLNETIVICHVRHVQYSCGSANIRLRKVRRLCLAYLRTYSFITVIRNWRSFVHIKCLHELYVHAAFCLTHRHSGHVIINPTFECWCATVWDSRQLSCISSILCDKLI